MLYAALLYTPELDWDSPEAAERGKLYQEFAIENAALIRGGEALEAASTATVVRVQGARGGDVVVSDGPYAETKEVLTGFFLLECADLDEAVKAAAQIPAAWHGAVEVRPVHPVPRPQL